MRTDLVITAQLQREQEIAAVTQPRPVPRMQEGAVLVLALLSMALGLLPLSMLGLAQIGQPVMAP